MRERARALLGGLAAMLSGCDGGTTPTPTVVEMTVQSSERSGAWNVGDTFQLTATARFSSGTTQDVTSQAAWGSSAPGVMGVSLTGRVTALAPGRAEISAIYQGLTGRLPLTVQGSLPDRIVLDSISPPRGTTLERGQAVTFTATASYVLGTAECGHVSLIIQDQTDRTLQPPPQPQANVTPGAGTVTLSGGVTIPDTGVTEVRVFLPLFACGSTRTSTVVSVSYAVR
jgi:Big-like domain-containing protein